MYELSIRNPIVIHQLTVYFTDKKEKEAMLPHDVNHTFSRIESFAIRRYCEMELIGHSAKDGSMTVRCPDREALVDALIYLRWYALEYGSRVKVAYLSKRLDFTRDDDVIVPG